MSVNKYKPHLFIIPEDDANRQIADGFTMHGFLIDNAIQVVQELGGWSNVLTTFKKEYVRLLGGSHLAYVLMVVDFDDVDDRRKLFEQHTPHEFRDRVFVIGAKHNPERLRQELNLEYEKIGEALASCCYDGSLTLWSHPHLQHNAADVERLARVVKPFIFRA